MDKKKLQEEQIKTDYQEEMEDAYMSIVQAIKRTREQISYLTIKATAKAIKEGIGNDLTILIKELVKLSNKIAEK